MDIYPVFEMIKSDMTFTGDWRVVSKDRIVDETFGSFKRANEFAIKNADTTKSITIHIATR